ncbi:MAG: hypothetical protein JRH07_04380 [Deltaproteobacteria bacterium]|nr:hypothetical protein [Deltaproteobacteria bacterium]MBW2121066.1 hypothetical protein [Deltaproteobacteria bacterium]
MEEGRRGILGGRTLLRLTEILLVFLGLTISGQGCVEVNRAITEGEKEHRLKRQMELAEEELNKGNLFSSRTLFDWIYAESKRPALRQKALFLSGLTILLDKNDKDRWNRGQNVLLRGSQEFPEGDFGRISGYVAAGLSDILSTLRALERENEAIRLKMNSAVSQAQEMARLARRQKKRLSEMKEEIRALKKSIRLRDKEVKNLEMKLRKLEEIHREIKKKRMGLS